MNRYACGYLAIAGLLCAVTSTPAIAQDRVAKLWSQAAELEEMEQYEDASSVYAEIALELPKSQRAAAKWMASRFKSGFTAEVVDAADAVIAMDPYGRVWAEWGYLYKVKSCRGAGCIDQARESIAILKSRFPDSISTAEAEVEEARLNGGDVEAAQEALMVELAAEQIHAEANNASRRGDRETALALFDDVIESFPDTRKSLRSREIKGLLLGLMPNREQEAYDTFDELVHEVELIAPHSRVRYEAELRKGFLLHDMGRKEEAYAQHKWLSEFASDPKVVAQSTLQATGLYFELIQNRVKNQKELEPGSWSELRRMCRNASSCAGATRKETVRSDLMYLESYAWEQRIQPIPRLAEAFLMNYTEPKFAPERAGAKLFLAEALMRIEEYETSLEHLRSIIKEFEGKRLWPEVEFKARVRFSILNTLINSNAPRDEVAAAARDFLDNHPDSKLYTDIVQNYVDWKGFFRVAPDEIPEASEIEFDTAEVASTLTEFSE